MIRMLFFFLKSLTHFSLVLSGFDLNWFVFFVSISYENGQFNYVNEQRTTAAKNTNNRMKSSIVWDCCHFSKVSYQTHLISCFFLLSLSLLCVLCDISKVESIFVHMYLCGVYVVVDIGVFFFLHWMEANGDEYKVNFTNCTSRINVSSHKYTVGGMEVHANNIDPII